MKCKLVTLLAILFLCSCGNFASAWTTVGDGIEYQEFTTSDPNRLFVCRMLRSNTNATLESYFPNGKLSGGTQIVRNQAALLDESISWWGQTWGARNDVIAAVNGDFWDLSTLIPTGGQIHSGWYCKRFTEYGGQSGFGWTVNRVPFMGDCAMHTASKQFITYPGTGNTQQFQGINRSRGSGELVIYTPQWANTTLTDNTGSEVLVELTTPFLIKPSTNYIYGYVREIRQSLGSTPIPFDHIVLSATGAAATTMLNNVSVGAEVRVSQEITGLTPDCSTSSGPDWTKTYASVGGNFMFLRNGVVQSTTNAGLTNNAPRTAIAYNDTYIYLVVVDGRQSGYSIGMSMSALGQWCINNLGATYGMNQDGGGSSTMVVNGVLKNSPSDGSERAVANSFMMVNVLPKQQTTTFTSGQQVTTNASASLRLGPGTNYGVLATISSGTTGTVQSHAMNGVLAKGYNWWKVSFSGNVGWVAESLLVGGGGCTAPSITTHPSAVSVNAGATASFTVAATGTTPLTYQWQKNSVNLSNGGDISGATSTTLSIANCEEADEGNYRCVVTNACGNATSNNAWLDVNSGGGGAEIILDEDQGTWSGSWSLSTGAGTNAYNGDYKYSITASSETAWYKWTPNITSAGDYAVYVMFRSGSNRPTDARYTIYYNGGSQTYSVDQTINGGTWILLGTKSFASGTAGYVKLGNNSAVTGKAVIADAVKWVQVGSSGPTITTQPSAQNVCPGSSANFTVAASGSGTLTYQWQKNQVNLSNGGHYSGVTTATLTVSSCDSNDAANYRCVVTDSTGSTNSNEAALTLKTTTAITTQPANASVNAGSTATFSIAAEGTNLTYQWRKNGTNLSNGGDISGATSTTLSIANCEEADEANYSCVVTGDCGSATSNNAWLDVNSGGGGTEVILDEDQGTSSGAWSLSTGAGTNAYNGDYKWASSATSETAWYKWTPNLTGSGNYAVYVMFRSGTNRATNAPYTIYYSGGSQTHNVNQTTAGGTWVLLGTKYFTSGTSGYVKLSNNTGSTGKVVIADAVRWVPQ